MEYSNWIWSEDWKKEYDAAPKAVLFRKSVYLNQEVRQADIRISADSRYKLYVNGRFVEAGPAKGDSQIWFYDEISIRSYLSVGENVLAVVVVRFPTDPSQGNQSILSTHMPGLFFQGEILEEGGTRHDVSAGSGWKCRIDERIQFVREAPGFAPLHFYEAVKEDSAVRQWRLPGFADQEWKPALPYGKGQIRDAVSPGNLNPRQIPFMRRTGGRFTQVMAVRESASSKETWENMLSGRGSVEIGPHSREIVEIHAGEEMTGYLYLLLEQGAGARIELLQSEAYVQSEPDERGKRRKTDRLDWKNGGLEGYSDIYEPSGDGTGASPEVYEPFWFRTFRFIRITVETGEETLTIRDFCFEETGYPLDIRAGADTSDVTMADLWDISARTLKRCMQETYIDCPFYEQLQYAMDSRAQILFTYAVSMDDRLARQCMEDFRRAQRYDGLISSAYPNTRPNVIPGFSIFYIWMLHDHMMYFGDQEWIRHHMPAVEQVLSFFRNNLTPEGYVGRIGGRYHQARYWSFIDWAPQWSVGVPGAVDAGPLTMESLLYLKGLQMASELAGYIGRTEQQKYYQSQTLELKEAIGKYCMDENGWIQDGPGFSEYSQHCQVFGILTGVLDKDTGRRNLIETLERKEAYAQCTVSMAWYLFRALEETGEYERTDGCWDIWRDMVKDHMSTVAESDEMPRSECHAWGALALYELPGTILGVRPAQPGFSRISVHPVPGYLSWASGTAVTRDGEVQVEWKKNETGEICMTVTAEEAVMEKIIKEKGVRYVSR